MSRHELECIADAGSAIRSGLCSQNTVAILQRQLDRTGPTITRKQASVSAKDAIAQRRDAREQLNGNNASAHAAKALATDVVSSALQWLSSTRGGHRSKTTSQNNLRPALQQISRNASPLPPRAGIKEEKSSPTRASQAASAEDSEDVKKRTIRCAQIGLNYLYAQTSKTINRSLVNATLIFCRHLVSNGLHKATTDNLMAIKRHLDVHATKKHSTKHTYTAKAEAKVSVKQLLPLGISATDDCELHTFAITYHGLLLRILRAGMEEAKVDFILSQLSESQCSLHAILIEQLKRNPDSERVRSHFESTAKALQCLAVKLESEDCTPLSTFKLHVHAIQWRYYDVGDNTHKLRAASHLEALRLLRASTDDVKACNQSAIDSYQLLYGDSTGETGSPGFAVHECMYWLADKAQCHKTSKKWLTAMIKDSRLLPSNHCYNLVLLIRRTLLTSLNADQKHCDMLASALSNKLTGQTNEYNVLILALADMTTHFARDDTAGDGSDVLQKLLRATLAFVQWFAISHPEIQHHNARLVVANVLCFGIAKADLMKCIKPGIASIFTQAGVLQDVVKASSCLPMKDAWTISEDAVHLSHILELDTACRIDPQQAAGCHDWTDLCTDPLQHATILEWQLHSAFRSASIGSRRGFGGLKLMVSQALSTLVRIHTTHSYPFRKASVAIKAYLFAGFGLISKEQLTSWTQIHIEHYDLAQDTELSRFNCELCACLAIARCIESGGLATGKCKDHLLSFIEHLEHAPEDDPHLVYDPTTVACLLETATSLFTALSRDTELRLVLHARLRLTKVLKRPRAITTAQIIEHCSFSYDDGSVLKVLEASTSSSAGSLMGTDLLYVLVVKAEVLVNSGDSEQCCAILNQALEVQQKSQGDRPASGGRPMLCLCARLWKVRSELALLRGNTYEALFAGRQAVKLINTAWHRTEKNEKSNGCTDAPDRVAESSAGTGNTAIPFHIERKQHGQQASPAGPGQWMLISVSCQIMMHLSKLYVHCGVYNDAYSYSEKAIRLAKSVRGSNWQVRTTAHHATVLAMAGKIDEAEVCLSSLDFASNEHNEAYAELLLAQALILKQQDSTEEAVRLFDATAVALDGLKVESERSPLYKMLLAQQRSNADASAPKHPNLKSQYELVKADHSRDKSQAVSRHSRCQYKVTLLKELTSRSKDIDLVSNVGIAKHTACGPELRRLCLQDDVAALEARMSRDVVLSSAKEAAWTWPMGCISASKLLGAKRSDTKHHKSTKRVRAKPSADTRLDNQMTKEEPLRQTTAMLPTHHSYLLGRTKLADISYESKLALKAMLLSSIVESCDEPSTPPCYAELPSMIAHHREQECKAVDTKDMSHDRVWPIGITMCEPTSSDSTELIREVSRSLPDAWTVVSLRLSLDHSRLIISRHRCDRDLVVVSVPFVKQDRSDDSDAIDFQYGQQELREIIQQSNQTCLPGLDATSKGAKSKWWRERERLDRRLFALITQMENDWLGGFQSLLYPFSLPTTTITTLDNSLKNILERHLRHQKKLDLIVDDWIVEALGRLVAYNNDTDAVEETVQDLLYLIVDIFRSGHVDVAYDEIDFDAMTVEVLAALRSLRHVARERSPGHLIMLLDKELQMFPWENMPCLEKTSVSRIASFALLSEKMKVMRRSQSCHSISRETGAVMLNPSSDLARTQEVLEPMIRQLEQRNDGWQSRIGHAPSEDQFEHALSTAGIFLYFGHGAGSQYIRPRAVRKLKQASRAVWLMGCSSAAATENGEFEWSTVPSAYMLAGETILERDSGKVSQECLTVLANLWDVTDKDIDRFSVAVGGHWGLWSAPKDEQPVKKSKSDRRHVVEAPKTPRLSGKVSTDVAQAIESARRQCEDAPPEQDLTTVSLPKAVALSRDTCFLRYLNGAAPVVFGIPVCLDN